MRMKRIGRNVATLGAVLLLVFMVGCVPAPGGITPPPAPEESTSAVTSEEVTPLPAVAEAPEANFRLLISDEANAIGDFESLVITIESVGVHKVGGEGEWIEMEAAEDLDLVLLQGENAEEIWSGDLPDGEYNEVFVYVTEVEGVLTNGDSTEVKLPSGKLHLNTHFSIPDDSPVSFVFDISVVAAGTDQSGIKYILKPVVSQSGPNQHFTEVRTREMDREREQEQEQEQEQEREYEEELDLELEGDLAPGATVTLLVTIDGEPVAGAVVEVNGEAIGSTTEDGTISFAIPEDAGELVIEAELDGQRGEMEVEL